MNLCLRRFTLTTSAIVLLTLTGWLDANAFQQRDRLVLTRAWPIEPVKIVAIRTKNKVRVERGKPFNEEDDWLDGLTLTLANNSAKTVTALSIELVFTEDGGPLPPWSWDLNFGPSPNNSEYLRRDTNKVIKIGQSVELGLSKERYQGLREGLKQSGNTRTITQLEIEVREVGFADGSMVQEGNVLSELALEGFAAKVGHRGWIQSVQGAVATWSNAGSNELLVNNRLLITDQLATTPCTDRV
jgi:hypothetical protein